MSLPPRPPPAPAPPRPASPPREPPLPKARVLPPGELARKVRDYEAFANDVLKARLAAISARRARLEAEREELADLCRGLADLMRQQQQEQQQQQQQQQQQEGQREESGGAGGSGTSSGRAVAPLKTLVDVGAGVYCRTAVPDPSRVCVAVGLGFHVEAPLAEAIEIAERRREALRAKADACVDEAAQVRAHLRFVAQAIGELQRLGRKA